MSLSPKQRAQLRSLAHPLKPVFHIGKDGVTETVLRSLLEAFTARELLKVKVQSAAPLSAASCVLPEGVLAGLFLGAFAVLRLL